jgi:vacuolar-type H+-ATPase catalytic subunit A/Vma1
MWFNKKPIIERLAIETVNPLSSLVTSHILIYQDICAHFSVFNKLKYYSCKKHGEKYRFSDLQELITDTLDKAIMVSGENEVIVSKYVYEHSVHQDIWMGRDLYCKEDKQKTIVIFTLQYSDTNYEKTFIDKLNKGDMLYMTNPVTVNDVKTFWLNKPPRLV